MSCGACTLCPTELPPPPPCDESKIIIQVSGIEEKILMKVIVIKSKMMGSLTQI